MISLNEFLENKPLYYTEIDYARMPRIYEKIKSNFSDTKIIHLIGTNGKGTTGRFLASALFNIGHTTAHYTSPHIMEFNERVWLNGKNASYESLENAHRNLQNVLSKEDSASLSYFEYTTLLAMILFNGCDYVVLEAGLGGEHDATAVFKKELTLITPVDYDHEAFLGSNIEDIASTKINSIQKSAIISVQKHQEVFSVAKNIAKTKGAKLYELEALLDDEDYEKISKISKTLSLASYLQDNLKLSISALKFLNIKYEAEDFKNSKLFGRLSRISDNVIVDVGHNPLAADSILKELEGEKYILIYNSYKDKDYKKILSTLKPIIETVEIIDIEDARIESKELLQKNLNELKIKYSTFKEVDEKNSYLVFGSFSVVEAFLGRYRVYE